MSDLTERQMARAAAEEMRERDQLNEAAPQLRKALADLVAIIDAAGLLNLSKGVQLGQTSWYVKASAGLEYARLVLRSAAGESDHMLTDDEKLRRIEDALVDDLMVMTEEEISAEMREFGENIDKEADRFRRIVRRAIQRADGQ